MQRAGNSSSGFTLIEILVVLAIVALLLTLAVPRYFGSVDRSKEIALKENLQIVRRTIDQFYSDTGRYPETLAELVDKKYLRELPIDPITGSTDTWIVLSPTSDKEGNLYDLKSGASGTTADGKPFGDL